MGQYGAGSLLRLFDRSHPSTSIHLMFCSATLNLPLRLCAFALSALTLSFLGAGCGHPDQANIVLRKRIQKQNAQLAQLKQQHDSDQQTIAGLERRSPTIAMLPAADLNKLWVTHGLKFGRLTGGIDLDPAKAGDEGICAYVSPMDEDGLSIQAAGSFVVELFDLAVKTGDNRLGRWTWDTLQAKNQWREFLLEYTYALTCPWQKVPTHPDITIRVTFTDELTHIPYTAEKAVHVKLPPPRSLRPTSAPASST